ncbi:MAG: glutamine amidotransferase [Pirellulales bacterium]
MSELHLQLQPVASWPVIAVLVAVLVGLLWVRPRFVRLSIGRWAALVALRLVVVLLTLVALLRPMLVYTKVEPVRASLVLLLDGSRSMQVEDSLGDASRWAAMRLLLDKAAGDLARLANTWDVKAYQFDAETRKLNIRDGRLELAASPEGEQSAIGAAIDEALERESSGRVLGMFLLSDGAQRAAAPRDLLPQVAVRRLAAENIPLHTFTFGKSGGSERTDLAIGDLVTNETIFTEAPTEVRGNVTAQGYANQPVRVQLLWESARGMEAVDTRPIETSVEGGGVPVLLRHTPKAAGEYKVTLRVEPREGELVTTNNEVSTFVTVRTGGIKVLYLAGAKRVGGGPGREQRDIRAALARSPDIVVERRLINYKPMGVDLRDAIRSGNHEVVILDDVDAEGLSSATWQALADRVRQGAGLLMIGGYHSFGPGGFRDNPLGDVLPIDIGPAQRQQFSEPPREDVHLKPPVRMRPSAPLGVRHPIMRIGGGAGVGGDVAAAWTPLPPLDGANLIARSELKPNASVLAEADDRERHPLLVAGQAGSGRTLAFAGDSTWHWPMEGFDDAHRRFWRQCVLWLAKQDEQTEGRVWIRLAGRRVMRGTRVDFNIGAENAEREPVDAARYEVVVQTPDGKKIDVQPSRAVSPKLPSDDSKSESRRDSPTWGATFRETAAAGDYRIVVTARDGNQVLGTAEARFLVPQQDMELDRPAAEPTLMAQLAEMTKPAGGAARAAEELPGLLKQLAAKPPELKEEVIAKKTYWDTWPFFLLFVGLLGVEWYLRKRWGLV